MIVSVLRKEARENLKGKWKKAFLMMIVFFAVTILLEFLKLWISLNTPYGMITYIFGLVVTIALNYGILASYIKLKRNEKVNVLHFIYFAVKDVEKIWKLILKFILKILAPTILLLLFIYLTVVEIISLIYGYGIRLSFFIEIIATIGLTIYVSMKTLYYSVMNYVLYDNKEWKAKDILKESQRLMKNHRWDFIKLNLTFSGWFILGIAFSVAIMCALYFWANINSMYLLYISYIPLVFLLPYIYVTTICFYDNLVYNNPKPKEEINTKKNKKDKKKTNKKK